MIIIAKRLKELRENRHLTLVQLAEQIKIPRATISRYENGTTSPTADNIIKYAVFFNETADYILGLEDMDGHKEIYDYNFEYQHEGTILKHKEITNNDKRNGISKRNN